jgi:alpha-mannosidase
LRNDDRDCIVAQASSLLWRSGRLDACGTRGTRRARWRELAAVLLCVFAVGAAAARALPAAAAEPPRPVHVVSNFHPASCGWLTDWSTERNYCANSYFEHLDRVRDDAAYSFALSECNNLIAMLNFRPERAAELKQRIREGRVELCNAFFLEPTINLSGGEALVKMGVEGLRWQQAIFGVRPRLSWMIDVTGHHEQMAQIVSGLGLEALVYCRLNPSGSTLHWLESPDGTRTLAISPGHYLEWRPVFRTKTPLDDKALLALAEDIRVRIAPLAPEQDNTRPDAANLGSPPRRTPDGAPVLILGGGSDYSLPPLVREYPARFLEQFRAVAPQYDVRFTTPSRYLDAVLPGVRSGAIALPIVRGGTDFMYKAFWIQNPRVKSWFRRCEQQLQAAEMLATAASLRGRFEYPARDLYHAWLLLCLNMDRNTLWGAAGGMVFEHERSWDARDRFEWVEKTAGDIARRAMRSLLGPGQTTVAFNSLNWRRQDLPALAGGAIGAAPAPTARTEVALPTVIETKLYTARVDPRTAALVSLKLRSDGREILGGPANVVVAEQPKKKAWSPADHMVDRPERERVADSNQTLARLSVRESATAVVVEAKSTFVGGGRLRRSMTFYREHPRIDCETELNDLPDRTVVVAEFPLAESVHALRRGVPFGFSQATADAAGALPRYATGITPAVRWSHYQMVGGGLALLDQGLSGREINDRTPVIYLYNAAEKYRGYPNAWLSEAGRHVVRYALVAHEGDFSAARVPQLAWEFNQPPIVVDGCASAKPVPFLDTSDNVIVEALRREGGEIELRLAECLGRGGEASVTLDLPHHGAALTDLVGGRRQPLSGGPSYKFPVRAQQIVTLRFRTAEPVAEIRPLTEWDELVPEAKRAALRRYLPDVKGHPPAGGQ